MSNPTRIGTFSSSEIHKLIPSGTRPMTEDELKAREKGNRRTTIDTDFSALGLTYIQEKRWERKLGLPIRSEKNARPSNWGSFCEKRAFDLLGFDYKLVSQDRLVHPEFKDWTGAPDCITEDATIDIKCPYSRAAFCKEVDVIESSEFPLYDEFPEYYWQLVSNSILTGKKYAELIVYMPYQSELADIKEMANNFEGGLNKISFISFAEEEELPYILDNGNYKNVNKLRWEVSKSDQELLTEKVKQAISLL